MQSRILLVVGRGFSYIRLMETRLPFEITPQPNDSTCGPSCLHAVYRYYGDNVSLEEVIAAVPVMANGGTLGVNLANHALQRGYRVTMYTYNLQMFDPTWFDPAHPVDLSRKLEEQALYKKDDPRLQFATPAYIEYLRMGGKLRSEDLTRALIRRYLNRGWPLITGLSSTYLYGAVREYGDEKSIDDDVRGQPSGHFVTLSGYDRERRSVVVADPYAKNPMASGLTYEADINRVLIAILLGVITYDANLMIIRPVS